MDDDFICAECHRTTPLRLPPIRVLAGDFCCAVCAEKFFNRTHGWCPADFERQAFLERRIAELEGNNTATAPAHLYRPTHAGYSGDLREALLRDFIRATLRRTLLTP